MTGPLEIADRDAASVGARVVQPLQFPQLAPRRIGKYDIESEIGHGTLVRVFRAFDQDTARPVKLKVLTGAADAEMSERFRCEVANLARLCHPGVIAIYELGEHAGLPFAATQHLDGDDLERAIRTQRPLTLLQKMLIMWQVAEAAQVIHRGGLPYVGIRPSSIALGSKACAIIQDFGIVRLNSEREDEDASYVSPEEAARDFVPDLLSDIFAFGAVYYELLTGSTGPTRKLAPDCPEALDRVVRRALEAERELRYQSFDEVQSDTEPILVELKRARAAVLLANARRTVGAQEFDEAQTIVRDVLELDPGNRQAQRLLASVRAQQQRATTRLRVETFVREADAEAAARRFDRAVEILISALQLDGANEELRNRLERMCSRVEQSRRTAQLLAEAGQLLRQEAFEDAYLKASLALENDPESAEANGLLPAIEAASQRHARLRAQYANAQSLIEQQQFVDAISILEPLCADFPDKAELSDLLMQAQQGVEEEARIVAAVRQTIEEVDWLLEQDRADLALQLLRDKSPACSDHPDVVARLTDIEKTLPAWEKRRFLRDVLGRVAALEHLQQWRVALTVVEEASRTHPAAEELREAADRLRRLQREQEHRKKLGRRLETIREKIALHAWPHALSLIEAMQLEFPGEPDLDPLHEQIRAGLKRSECEAIASEVRRCLADGDAEQAEVVLKSGLASWGGEPSLQTLWEELEAHKNYREEWQAAQLLFGRRQFHEAEEILVRLAAPDRPEVQGLLETVRAARAASEEEQFYDRGRDKALELIRGLQFEQAADLLRNLLSLFPADPILERDLQSALSGCGHGHQEIVASSIAEPPVQEPAAQTMQPNFMATAPARVRWTVLAVTALLLLVSASAAFWKLSRNEAPVKPQILVTTQAPRIQTSQPRTTEPAAPAKRSVAARAKPELRAAVAPARPFLPPPLQSSNSAPTQAAVIPPPPGVAATVADRQLAAIPGDAPATVSLLAPPPPKTQAASETLPPAPRAGGNYRGPQLISGLPAVFPQVAKDRGISGVVSIEATVDKQGAVVNVVVLSGHALLVPYAKDAVLKRRYQPATLNGEPLEVKFPIKVVFDAGSK